MSVASCAAMCCSFRFAPWWQSYWITRMEQINSLYCQQYHLKSYKMQITKPSKPHSLSLSAECGEKMLSRSRTFFCNVVVLGGEKCMDWKAFPAQNFNVKPLTRQDKSQTYPKSLPPTAHRVPRPLLHGSVFAWQNKQLYKRASSLSSSQQGKEREKTLHLRIYSAPRGISHLTITWNSNSYESDWSVSSTT